MIFELCHLGWVGDWNRDGGGKEGGAGGFTALFTRMWSPYEMPVEPL